METSTSLLAPVVGSPACRVAQRCWALAAGLFLLLMLSGALLHQSAFAEAGKAGVAPVTKSATQMRLSQKGAGLYLEVEPSPVRLSFSSAGKYLGAVPGKGQTRFEITSFAQRTATGDLRVTAYAANGTTARRTFDVSDYTTQSESVPQQKWPTSVAPRHPAIPAPVQQGSDRMSPATERWELNAPRQPSADEASGKRDWPGRVLSQPAPVPGPPQPSPSPGWLPGGPERGGSGFRPPDSSAGEARRPAGGFVPLAPSATEAESPPTAVRQQGATASGKIGEGMARISGTDPTPSVVGRPLTVRGQFFGARGTATLDLAGLRLRPRVIRWSETEVELEMSEQMAPLLGAEGSDARLWLWTQANGGASTAITLVPDPLTLAPEIHGAPGAVRPGEEITITGVHFLAPQQGIVFLDCPGGGISSEILSWADNRIRVIPAAAFSRRVGSSSCELVVSNHRGLEVRRPVYLEVELARETFRASGYHDFSEAHPPYFEIVPKRLLNGWLVTGSSFSVNPEGGGRYSWIERPANNQPEIAASINGEMSGLHAGGPPRGRKRIILEFAIEGPRGLPYATGFGYPGW